MYVFVGDSVCLACYVANGHIMVYSLPSLKLLLDVEFLALTDLRYHTFKLIRFFSVPAQSHTFLETDHERSFLHRNLLPEAV